MEQAAALWQFSLTLYAAPGVARQCLRLQDQWQANVNLMLWLVWLEHHGQLVDSATVERAQAAIAIWNQSTSQPLRALRRQLGDQLTANAKQQAEHKTTLYQQLKGAELLAEQVEQDLLANLVTLPLTGSHTSRDVNINLYLNRLKVPEAERREFLSLL
jgi:uncharacterized protein (TIGR02444 family)